MSDADIDPAYPLAEGLRHPWCLLDIFAKNWSYEHWRRDPASWPTPPPGANPRHYVDDRYHIKDGYPDSGPFHW